MLSYLKTNGLVIVLIALVMYQQSLLSSVWSDVGRANDVIDSVELRLLDLPDIAFLAQDTSDRAINLEVESERMGEQLYTLYAGFTLGSLAVECNR